MISESRFTDLNLLYKDTRSHLLERTKPKHANLEAKRRQLNRVNIADPLVLELKGRETNQDEISFGQD